MVKKLFVLASITALTGLVTATVGSGCSSTTVSSNDGVDSSMAKEAGPKPVEAGPPDPEPEAGPGTCPSTDPITAADIEMSFKWVAPAAPQSLCNQKNLDDLKQLFVTGKGSAKFEDIRTSLGTTCSPCVFTKQADANWGPIVQTAKGFLQNDEGSCAAQYEGAACGKALFESSICFRIACPQADCTDQTACVGKAAKGACKGLVAAANTACPNLSATLDLCGGILDSIAVNCGGGKDSGLDSSTGN